jgi:formylglycine-generating enzyme
MPALRRLAQRSRSILKIAKIEQPFVLIAGATFLMGTDDGRDDERPAHRVWVDSFELGACQVTNGEFAAFLQATGHPPPCYRDEPGFDDPEQPVVAVSWFDAMAYCGWLGGVTETHVRLATEAEWECAARGGLDRRLHPWGDDPPESRANYGERWRSGPEPVGCGAPNGYGLYDICENVHEWCSDWYDASYYTASPSRNPTGPENGLRRVSRGGSWRHRVKISRCAARSSIAPELQYTDYGLRIARSVSG